MPLACQAPSKKKREQLKKLNLANPWHLIAVGFGTGLCPKAPGTCGSFAAGIICYVLLAYCSHWALAAVLLVTCVAGTIACSKAEQAMGVHDHGGVVIDEFAGMFLTALTVPAGWALTGAVSSFVFFRIFDILKPFPVSLADRKIGGGLGIMADDVVAALYAALCNYMLFAFML